MTTKHHKSVLFVQGGGDGTHDAWDNKLVASLEQALGRPIRYPRMPNEDEPDVTAWKHAIGNELDQLPDGAIVVGHSIGAAILLEHLAERGGKKPLAGIFLIAMPYFGDGGWPSDDLRPTKALAATLPASTPIHLYQGDADDTVSLAHVDLLAKALPRATVHRLPGRDHQLGDDLTEVAHDIRQL